MTAVSHCIWPSSHPHSSDAPIRRISRDYNRQYLLLLALLLYSVSHQRCPAYISHRVQSVVNSNHR